MHTATNGVDKVALGGELHELAIINDVHYQGALRFRSWFHTELHVMYTLREPLVES